MNKNKSITRQTEVHLISDNTGLSINSLSHAILSRMYRLSVKKYIWSFKNNKTKILNVLEKIHNLKSFVICTIVDKDLQNFLIKECEKRKILCLPIILKISQEIERCLNLKPETQIEKPEKLIDEADYARKINAINYSIAHDDGQGLETINQADVIIIGASRTSKTPTSIYIANQGYKVANIPYINNIELPKKITELSNKEQLIVGFIMDVNKLSNIRQSRMKSMKEIQEAKKPYTDIEQIFDEMNKAKKFFLKNDITIIDTTNKSIEEASTEIIDLINNNKQNKY